jgi:hypothetical protein
MRAALPPVRVAKSRPVVSQRRVGAPQCAPRRTPVKLLTRSPVPGMSGCRVRLGLRSPCSTNVRAAEIDGVALSEGTLFVSHHRGATSSARRSLS